MVFLMRSTGTQPKRAQEFKVRFSSSDSIGDRTSLVTISQNQVNVILKIASVLPSPIDTRVKIESSGINGCILRDLLTGEFIIKSRRVPYSIRGKNDVRKLPQFFVSGWAHVHIRKARAVGKGDVIPFRGDDVLLTALTAWSIMDLSAESPDLSSRMDGISFSIASILVHEDNGRAPMGLYKTSSSDQGKISNGGLPNPGDMTR
jgi:hypothetical protein